MSPSVGFGCCVGSWERFNSYVVPHAAGRPIMALSGQTSIAAAYNQILDAYRYEPIHDMIILQHDDLEILSPTAEERIAELMRDQPDIGLVGVAGGSARGGLAWWNHDPVGHQGTDARMIDFGQREGNVDLLEGSFLAFSPWALANLRFDERPGFHGYDEIAMQAARKGMRVVVADIDTHHHTPLGFDNELSQAEWWTADQWFREKWGIG
jgi:hypothetical protein